MGNKVSIIVTIYNIEQYLSKCLESIVQQTYNLIEIILVDDGSTDSSGEVCEQFANRDERIRVIHKKNEGLSSARNMGICEACGEYLFFVDGDDWIEKNCIETLMKGIKRNSKVDMVLCGIQYVDEGYNVYMKSELEDDTWGFHEFWDHYFNKEKVECAISCNKLFRRELFESIKYPNGKIHEDEYVINKLFKKGCQMEVISDCLYNYYQRHGSITNTDYNIRRLDIIDAYIDRTKMMVELVENDFAYKSLEKAICSIVVAYRKLDLKVDGNYLRFKKERKKVCELIKTNNIKVDIYHKCKNYVFCSSIWLFSKINMIKN